MCFIPAVKDASPRLMLNSETGKNIIKGTTVKRKERGVTVRLKYDVFICLPHGQMQMFQVWLQLHGGPAGVQISPVTEGGPGWLHIWCNSVWNVFEPILWH